ncbi:MAG: alpha-E domain-containing protein [Pseudomonadota bacterium]
MLGKTAGGLFWLYRYLERAENTARLIETGQRIALTRLGAGDREWRSVLQTAGSAAGYEAKYGDISRDRVVDWMLRDRANPGAVLPMLDTARSNARMVRTALTHEVWEAVNAGWMEIKDALSRRVSERDLPRVLSLIRERTALVRGATHGTMMRNDIYDFARIGTFLERADNTGRILDVKYYVLLPSAYAVGSSLDNVQWETILRSLSANGAYRMAHGHDVDPRRIAEFLVLDRRMPRSLWFCAGKIRDNLTYLSRDYGTVGDPQHKADVLVRRFMSHDIEAVFRYGLHEYLQDVLAALADISNTIEVDYRFSE